MYMAVQVPLKALPLLFDFEEFLQFFIFNCIVKCSIVLKGWGGGGGDTHTHICKDKFGNLVTVALHILKLKEFNHYRKSLPHDKSKVLSA